ncbi:MAG: ComEA family DNA-binding protein [Flavobacteriales bacterium]
MNYPFLFARKERKGLYVLLLLSAAFIAGKFYFFPPSTAIHGNEMQSSSSSLPAKKEYKIPASSFDPNTLKATDWIAMGLDDKVAARIEKYVTKGGHFHQPSDLLRVYGMDTAFYKKVEDKIGIASKEEKHSKKNNTFSFPFYERKAKPVVEVNAATAEQLMEVEGIGEKLAGRIIKYRDLLGGFVAKEQLKEVYGMDSVNYLKIQKQISIDPSLLKRININTASMEELSKVKFFGAKRAKVIYAYREQHGAFASVKDLLKTRVLNDSILYLAEPYILIDDSRKN